MHRRSFMGPIDPQDDEVGKAENAAGDVKASDPPKKTRVVVDMYPWYGASGTSPTQVETAPHDLEQAGKQPPEK